MHLDRISAEICFKLTITSNVVNLSGIAATLAPIGMSHEFNLLLNIISDV